MSSQAEPTRPLTDDQVRRYARHILLPDVGGVGQQRLLAAAVAVEVGAEHHAAIAALAYLAAGGVGTLVLTGDAAGPVTEADVTAGILYAAADVGRPRLDALRDRIAAINPDVRVVAADAPHDVTPLSLPAPSASTGTIGRGVVDALTAGGAAAVKALGELS